MKLLKKKCEMPDSIKQGVLGPFRAKNVLRIVIYLLALEL